MSLSKEVEKLKYDKRLLEWNVSRGRLTKEERDQYLASLPDLASNVENLGMSTAPEEELDESLYLPEDDEDDETPA
jgi:hypothetical protein